MGLLSSLFQDMNEFGGEVRYPKHSKPVLVCIKYLFGRQNLFSSLSSKTTEQTETTYVWYSIEPLRNLLLLRVPLESSCRLPGTSVIDSTLQSEVLVRSLRSIPYQTRICDRTCLLIDIHFRRGFRL